MRGLGRRLSVPAGGGPVTACTVQGMARVRSGQACPCPVVSGRSVRRGSGVKRDFACTFTRHYSPVHVALRSQSRLRLEGRTRTLSGPSPDLSPARTLAPSACRAEDLLIRRFPRGRPAPFRTVRDLGRAPVGYPQRSGETGSRSSVWLPAGVDLDFRSDISDLRITRVFSCVARGFEARPSFMFAGCCSPYLRASG